MSWALPPDAILASLAGPPSGPDALSVLGGLAALLAILGAATAFYKVRALTATQREDIERSASERAVRLMDVAMERLRAEMDEYVIRIDRLERMLQEANDRIVRLEEQLSHSNGERDRLQDRLERALRERARVEMELDGLKHHVLQLEKRVGGRRHTDTSTDEEPESGSSLPGP